MKNRDFQYNRYGEKDVRPGHFRHGGGIGSIYRGETSHTTLPAWSDDPRSEAAHEDHTGKGPKGWSRSDAMIKDDVSEALSLSWDVDASEIEVSAESGVVTLMGVVADREQKKAAESVTETIAGVEDVRNFLTLKPNEDLPL